MGAYDERKELLVRYYNNELSVLEIIDELIDERKENKVLREKNDLFYEATEKFFNMDGSYKDIVNRSECVFLQLYEKLDL